MPEGTNQKNKRLTDEIYKLNQMLKGTAVPTFAVDLDGRITHWNTACEMLTGMPAGEIVGTNRHRKLFYENPRPVLADLLVTGADLEQLNRYYKGIVRKSQFLDTGYEGEDFFPGLGPNGKWLFFTAAPLRDATGRMVGAIETIQDTSARRRAETDLRQNEIRYRSLFESANDAIFLLAENKVIDCNKKATALFQCEREDLLGRTVLDFSPDRQTTGITSKDRAEEIRRLFNQEQFSYFEWRFRKQSGAEFDAEVSLTRFELFNTTHAITIVRDVTEKKALIEALQSHERELNEKSTYLEKVNQALKASLDHREVEKRSIEETLLTRVRQFVTPYLDHLGRCNLNGDARAYLKIVETNLRELLSPFSHTIFSKFIDFTPAEVRVANFIREGHDTKEIAHLMGLSPSTIQWHRKNIRAKLNLSNKKQNLYQYLNSFPK